MNGNIVSLFNKRLDGHGALKTALVFLKTDGTEEKYSWYDYQKKALCVVEWLKAEGIKKGDFVAVIPLNLPESFFAMLGIIMLGAVPVPINVQLLKETGLVDLRKIIDDCKPKLILANESLGGYMRGVDFRVIEKIIKESETLLPVLGHYLKYFPDIMIFKRYSDFYHEAKGKDLLIMPYTSGTSGPPKGTMLTHKNILNRLEAVASTLKVTSEERVLSYLPLGHVAELITTFFGQIYCGYPVYFTEYAKEILANRERFGKKLPLVLQRVKSSIFIAVPGIWMSFKNKIEAKIKNTPILEKIPQWLKRFVVKRKLFSHTRIFISAGAKIISKEGLEFFTNLGIPISDIYGQTETAGPLTLNGSVLGPNIKVAVENGEIVVIGDCVMAGYYQNPSANSQVFSKNGAGEVVYHTGDTGVERDGKIFWTGRVGDGFKGANGEYYQPDKIGLLEEKIKKIDPRIGEVIVCGINRPYLIALIFSENYLDKNLKDKIRLELPQIGEGMYKIRGFDLINSVELELTPTMKVKRNLMLEKLAPVIDSLYK